MDGIQIARNLIAKEKEGKTGFIDLGFLGLSELPAELFELDHLIALNLGSEYRDCYGIIHDSKNLGQSNEISFLPTAIDRLRSLQHLSLSEVSITNIESIRPLKLLQTLDLSYNSINDLIPLMGLSDLRTVAFNGTRISCLAPVSKLLTLQTLEFAYSDVRDLEPLRGLPILLSVDCSGTGVNDLSPLRDVRSLLSIACWRTQVKSLEPIKGLPVLQSVDCSATAVSDISPLGSLRVLLSVDCSHTTVSDLQPLKRLLTLQSVNCSSTAIKDLKSLKNLRSLQSVNCSSTAVTSLWPLIGTHTLQSINCSGSGISDLGPLKNLAALQSVDCSHTGVSDLSPLKGLQTLQSINCFGSAVTDLGPLMNLVALQSVNCSHTGVSDLSPLKDLQTLQSVNCSGSAVTDLEPLKNLAALQSVDCSHTGVSDLRQLKSLFSLEMVDCSGTTVNDLEPLKALPALQSLNCSYTQVTDLGLLAEFPVLNYLDAGACSLKNLPSGLVFKESLRNLGLHDADILEIPREILSKNPYANCLHSLRAHFADLEAGAEQSLEAKLIVLGNGRIGKTQLSRRLRGLPYDESIGSTHGITVTSQPWSNSAPAAALNIWDFGGQDIYHGAHTLFMKTSAIFVLGWHPDFETALEQEHAGLIFRNYPLSYWLEYVRTLGRRDSPVIVIQSQCERPDQEVKHLPVDQQFTNIPFLKQCWYSAKKDRGRAALNEAIREAIDYLRERDGVSTVGAGRMRVLRKLKGWRDADLKLPTSQRQHRTLSQEEFRQICAKTTGVSSPEKLLEYLHNLGVVFYQENLFHDRIILDQSWALDAVYAIFEREKSYRQILAQGGRFTRSLLELGVWRDYTEAEQNLFLSLMQSCGISFVSRAENKGPSVEAEFIAPDLLPEKSGVAAQLAGRWDDAVPASKFECEYDLLHPGLARSIICDAGARSGEAGVYWKYGFWVYDKESGCRMLFEQQMTDHRRGKLTVRIQGLRNESLSEWIRERIEERSRLFGYPDIKPVVNEFPPIRQRKDLRVSRIDQEMIPPSDTAEPIGSPSGKAQALREPKFEKLPAEAFPAKEPQVFISYSWGDQTPEGKLRQKTVDDLCNAMKGQGVEILRDCEQMTVGDRINEFMDRLIEGDFIIAIISDKYLRSPYCMYELFGIFRNCQHDSNRFLGKVIPLILPDAKLKNLSDRIEYAGYWKAEKDKLKEQIDRHGIDVVGAEAIRKYKKIAEFATNVSDILEYLVDMLMPRDLDRMTKEGFQEIIQLLGRSKKLPAKSVRKPRKKKA